MPYALLVDDDEVISIMLDDEICPVCGNGCAPLDVVDFNKSCELPGGNILRLSGIPVYYYFCDACGFCFAPELCRWELKEFSEKIYNEQYVEVDSEYEIIRPETNAANLVPLFRGRERSINHLDYGGGNGLLSDLLKKSGWRSTSYDPFVDGEIENAVRGKFNLITAYEVFEHVPDVNALMSQIAMLLEPEGIVLFSTLLSDGYIERNLRLNWWYASPRNGHISLFSRRSLELLAGKYEFILGSFSTGFHILYRKRVPAWASHLFRND